MKLLKWLTKKFKSNDAEPRQPQRKHAIVSIISDNVIGLGATFVASLHEALPPNHKIDLILLTNEKSVPLSLENRLLILKIYPNTIFMEVGSEFLTEENTKLTKFKNPVSCSTREAPFLKFHLFKLDGYKRVLWLDSDMFILHDFTEVFSLPHDICVVRSGPSCEEAYFGVGLYQKRKFNSGFMLFGPAILKKSTFKAAVKLLNKRTNFILRDQPLLNQLFRTTKKFYLPHTYNWKLSVTETGWADEALALQSAKIIHFLGSSKWHLTNITSTSPLALKFHALRKKYSIPLVMNP